LRRVRYEYLGRVPERDLVLPSSHYGSRERVLRTVDSGTFRSLAICALFRPSSYFPIILPRKYGLNSSPGFRLLLIVPKGRRGIAILCDIRRRVKGGRRDFSRKTRFAHRLMLTYCRLRHHQNMLGYHLHGIHLPPRLTIHECSECLGPPICVAGKHFEAQEELIPISRVKDLLESC